MQALETTLRLLDTWYNEPGIGGERPKLLSKLAVLELCGWIEGEFDRMILELDLLTINDKDWIANNLLSRTHGFTYSKHFRPMACGVLGEVLVRDVEAAIEAAQPGMLERFKSSLGVLWDKRCAMAHADVGANLAAQVKFDAPSWTINQHRVISKQLVILETELTRIVRVIRP